MGVCNSVRTLSQAVLDKGFILEPREKLQLEILKLTPLYLEINNLALWEAAFQGTLLDIDTQSQVSTLANEIYQLAIFNMYGAFDPKATHKFVRNSMKVFHENGIKI